MESENNTELHSNTESHWWPHIPAIQWKQVVWPITNTTVATFLFLMIVVIVSIMGKKALSKPSSKFKMALLNIIGFMDKNLSEWFGDKKFARSFFPLIAWIFIIILFWNLFWLIIDWVWASVSPTILEYIRPMHSDLNTTLVLWIITVISFLGISCKYVWSWKTIKSYLFNFTWEKFWDKLIWVLVWWLHLIWLPATVASLSLRLFGNIFAWIVLIWVISFLWGTATSSIHLLEIWRFLSIPFWFFEVFVALIQAIVFAWLMVAYFSQNKSEH